ncbi:TonB-dependent receptor [Polyangium sp. y55x31]|uniref:TonB-dependent receptor family protein n=1 Tax=Polyangium sp. y55x31 TaxID=3042688 RepID=UPI002482C397|nr:TonB-dependent receptor [Polyangium sp. y55x31]MDI1478251.1 TonB-dependent receptor [Polyangium sp. y55x31]
MRPRTLLGSFFLLACVTPAFADEAKPAPPAPDAPPNEAPAKAAPSPDAAPAKPKEGEAEAQAAPSPVIEVSVLGRSDDALQKVPGSGTLIGAKEIRRAMPAETGEILRRVPGLVVRPEEGLGLRLNVGMRGLDPTRSRQVLILEDGMPVAINPYGEPDLYYSTPVERIRAVEVVKGSGSILFGPQTIGGVVNFLTALPPDKPEWSLEAQAGQRNYFKLSGLYGGTAGDARYVLQFTRKQGDGFRDIEFHATDFMGKVAFPTSARGEATFKIAVYDEFSRSTYVGLTRHMFELDPRTPSIAPHDGFNVRRYDASLMHEYRFSEATRLRTFLYGYITDRDWRRQNYDREAKPDVTYERIVGDPTVSGAAIYFRNTSMVRDRDYQVLGIEPRVEHRFETGRVRHTITAGARAHIETADRKQFQGDIVNTAAGNLETREHHRTFALAGYIQDRLAFRDDLLVTPGVRVEYAANLRSVDRTAETGTSKDVTNRGTSDSLAVMPGIGMVYGTPKLNFFGGVHVGYAPPRVSAAILPGGQDAQLDAEESTNYEIGMRLARPKWIRAEVTGFVMSFRNQIVTGTEANGQQSELANGGRTLHRGAEAQVTVGLGQALSLPLTIDLTGRYTFSVATFRGGPFDGNRLPYAPLHTASATLDVEHRIGIGGQVAWSYLSDQFADEYNTVLVDPTGRIGVVPAYHLVDVALRYRHAKTGLGALLTVKNALDQVFVATRLPDGIQTGGFRQINVGLRWDHR